MLKSFTTILLLGAAKALTVDDVSDLQVEFVHGISSSATEWYPSYVSSDNSNKTLTSGSDDGEGISSSYWSYSEGSGYEQILDYGLKVFAYENDDIMGNMDTTDGAALSFEAWVRVANEDNWKSNAADSPKGWVMSYETGWGPAICLKDSRVNNGGSGGVGATPGNDVNQGIDTGYYGSSTFINKFGETGTLSQSKNGWDHFVGYWENTNGAIERGLFVNGYPIPQASTSTSGIGLDITNRQLAIGNYNSAAISNSAHSTKGLAISGFRVWHKRIDQSLAADLYDLGNTASVLTSLSSPSTQMLLDCHSYHNFPVDSLPKSGNSAFQRNSWHTGCGYADNEANGNINTCQNLCTQGSGGCCYQNQEHARCYSNSCSGGGCCAASRTICQAACTLFYSPPPLPPSPPPPPPAKYTYTFEINENVAVSHMEITKILIDGEFPETDLVTVLLEQNSIRDGTDETVMHDNISASYLQWANYQLATGTQVLEIKTRKVVKEFEISYWRPKYAPGWKILLDGQEVVKETENRGSDSYPSPATFTYDVVPTLGFALYSSSMITADACFLACDLGVAVAHSDEDVARIKAIIPTQYRVWVGLKKENGLWMRGNEVYDGGTRWANTGEGNTGEIRVGMVYNINSWAGDWYGMPDDGREHYCVCYSIKPPPPSPPPSPPPWPPLSHCDASQPPKNGGVGNCSSLLPIGHTCKPTCDEGFMLAKGGRQSYCASDGKLSYEAKCVVDGCFVIKKHAAQSTTTQADERDHRQFQTARAIKLFSYQKTIERCTSM